MEKHKGDSSNNANRESQAGYSEQISKFLRSFYSGGDGHRISSEDSQRDNHPDLSAGGVAEQGKSNSQGSSSDQNGIRVDIDKTSTLLDRIKKIDSIKPVVEEQHLGDTGKAPSTGQLIDKAEEMLQYENAMRRQGVNPREFKDKYRKVLENLGVAGRSGSLEDGLRHLELLESVCPDNHEHSRMSHYPAGHHNQKKVTSQNINEYLSQWEHDRTELSNLIDKFRQEPKKIQEEAAAKLPGLVKEAQATLEKLNRIQDWKNRRAKLDQQTKAIFTLNREIVIHCIQDYNNQAEIPENDTLLRLYTELDYSTRTLSPFVDNFNKKSSSDVQSSVGLQENDEVAEVSISHLASASDAKSQTRKSLENLLREVSRLPDNIFDSQQKLEDHLYNLCTENKEQAHFSDQSKKNNLKQSLDSIRTPQNIKIKKGEYLSFYKKTKGENSHKRRIMINCHPDHLAEVMKDLVQELPNFPYIYQAKAAYSPELAISRRDNIVIYFYDPPENDNKAALGEMVLEKCGKYTRPDIPSMMDLIDNKTPGIAFADSSKTDSFGFSRAAPIAAVVWKLHTEHQQITYETILPKVEEAYRLNGIDPDDPQWNTK